LGYLDRRSCRGQRRRPRAAGVSLLCYHPSPAPPGPRRIC